MNTIGCGTAIITPFLPDGSLDEAALRAHVDWQIESGIDFLVACGSTGEAATLDEDEWLRIIHIVIEAAAGRVPVWAGCTSNNTKALVKQAAKLRAVPGLGAVLSANPYYNKPSQEGQFQHFLALAKAVAPLPVVLYNIPGRTAANLLPETIGRLAAAAPNIEAVKESCGQLAQIAQVVHAVPAGFKVYMGDDNLALAGIGVGAQGLISVASNEIPAEMSQMIHHAMNCRQAEAREIERRYMRLIDGNFFEPNPCPVKTVMSLMGRCGDTVRLPLVPTSAATRTKLEKIAGELGLLKHLPVPDGCNELF